MKMTQIALVLTVLSLAPVRAQWPAAKAPAVPGADGFVSIPGAAVPPEAGRIYRAVFDLFHGAAVDGILDAAHYRARFHADNPNLRVLGQLRKAGVPLYVCGQYLAFEHIDPKTLSPDVYVASDALIVLMRYQNDGFALMSF